MRNRCIGVLRLTHLSRRAGAVALLAALWLVASAARGQTVYRWTDERGVVHFSDSPPPAGTEVQVQNMPAVPAAPTSDGGSPDDAPAPGLEATPAAAAAGAAAEGGATAQPGREKKGPAQLEVRDEQVRAQDGGVREFSGAVKNVGGTTARDVVVVISVTEPVQGASCVREEVDVQPSVLKPGEVGSYSIELENPCFFGAINTEVTPDWR